MSTNAFESIAFSTFMICIGTSPFFAAWAMSDVAGHEIIDKSEYVQVIKTPKYLCRKVIPWANDQVVRICKTLDECNTKCGKE